MSSMRIKPGPKEDKYFMDQNKMRYTESEGRQ